MKTQARLGLVMLATFGLLAFSQLANANQVKMKYSGPGTGTTLDGGSGAVSSPISFTGILTLGAWSPNVAGTGIGGWDITALSGARNGVNVLGIVPNPNFPGAIQVGSVLFDNGVLQGFGLTNNGLAYNTVDGNVYNLFSVNATDLLGGGDLEAPNGNFDYQPVTVSLTSVPDSASSASLLIIGFSCLGLVRAYGKRQKSLQNVA